MSPLYAEIRTRYICIYPHDGLSTCIRKVVFNMQGLLKKFLPSNKLGDEIAKGGGSVCNAFCISSLADHKRTSCSTLAGGQAVSPALREKSWPQLPVAATKGCSTHQAVTCSIWDLRCRPVRTKSSAASKLTPARPGSHAGVKCFGLLRPARTSYRLGCF